MRMDLHVMSALVFLIRVIRMMLIMQTLCEINICMVSLGSALTIGQEKT